MGKELEFIEELKALARELKQQGFSNEEIQARLDAKKKEFKSVKKSTTPKSPGVDTENFSGSELDDFFSDSVTEENASAPWEKKAYESEFVGPKIPEKGLPEFQYLSDPKIKNSKKFNPDGLSYEELLEFSKEKYPSRGRTPSGMLDELDRLKSKTSSQKDAVKGYDQITEVLNNIPEEEYFNGFADRYFNLEDRPKTTTVTGIGSTPGVQGTQSNYDQSIEEYLGPQKYEEYLQYEKTGTFVYDKNDTELQKLRDFSDYDVKRKNAETQLRGFESEETQGWIKKLIDKNKPYKTNQEAEEGFKKERQVIFDSNVANDLKIKEFEEGRGGELKNAILESNTQLRSMVEKTKDNNMQFASEEDRLKYNELITQNGELRKQYVNDGYAEILDSIITTHDTNQFLQNEYINKVKDYNVSTIFEKALALDYSETARAAQALEEFFIGDMVVGSLSLVGELGLRLGKGILAGDDEKVNANWQKAIDVIKQNTTDYSLKLAEKRKKTIPENLKIKDAVDGKVGYLDWLSESFANNSPSILTTFIPAGLAFKGAKGVTTAVGGAARAAALTKQATLAWYGTKAAQSIFFLGESGGKFRELGLQEYNANKEISELKVLLKDTKDINEIRDIQARINEIEPMTNYSFAQKSFTSYAFGGVATYAETLGSLKLIQGAGSLAAKIGLKEFKQQTYKTMPAFGFKLLKETSKAVAPIFYKGMPVEIMEETFTQIAHNALDVVVLGEDKGLMEGVDKDFILNTAVSVTAIMGPTTGGNVMNVWKNEFRIKKDVDSSQGWIAEIIKNKGLMKSAHGKELADLRNNQRELLKNLALVDVDNLQKLRYITPEQLSELDDVNRRMREIRKEATRLGGLAEDAGPKNKALERLQTQFNALQSSKNEILGAKQRKIKQDEKNITEKLQEEGKTVKNLNFEYHLGLYDLYESVARMGLPKDGQYIKLDMSSQEAAVDQLYELGYDRREGSEIYLNLLDANATVDGNNIIINETQIYNGISQSITNAEGAYAALAPLEELFHLNNKGLKIVDKNGNLKEQYVDAVNQTIEKLKDKKDLGETLTGPEGQNLYDALIRRFEAYKTGSDVDYEELLAQLNNAVALGVLTRSDFNNMPSLSNMVNQSISEVFGNESWLLRMNNESDVFNFIKNFQNKNQKSRIKGASPEDDQDKTRKKSVALIGFGAEIDAFKPAEGQTLEQYKQDANYFKAYEAIGKDNEALNTFILKTGRQYGIESNLDVQAVKDNLQLRFIKNYNPVKNPSLFGWMTSGKTSPIRGAVLDQIKAVDQTPTTGAKSFDVAQGEVGAAPVLAAEETKAVESVEAPKSQIKQEAPELIDQAIEDDIETAVLEIAEGVFPDVNSKEFLPFIKEVIDGKLTNNFKTKFGTREQYDNFINKIAPALKRVMPASFFVKLESTLKPEQRQFTEPPVRLTTQADIDKARDNEQINYLENDAQGVNLYKLKKFTPKELASFINPPATNIKTGKKSGLKGTRKTSVATSVATQSAFDMMPSIFKGKVSEFELAKINEKIQRDPRIKFSKAIELSIQDLFRLSNNNPNFDLELAGINKLNTQLTDKGLSKTLDLKELVLTEDGRIEIVKTFKWIMANLGPREMWFGKQGKNKFTTSGSDYGVSMSEFKEDGSKNPKYSKAKIDALTTLRDELNELGKESSKFKFGKPIDGVTDYTVASYSTLLGNPKKAATKNKKKSDGSPSPISEFNTKVRLIHEGMWTRIYDLIGDDKKNAPIVGTYLKLVANHTGHWHKMGAEIVGWSTNPKGIGKTLYEYEHAMPATAAYLYLMDVALNQTDFESAYNAVMDNYKLIALDKAENAKLGKAGLGRGMPADWMLGDNYWWQRYFNKKMAGIEGGINPASIVFTNGRTFEDQLQIDSAGQLSTPALVKAKQNVKNKINIPLLKPTGIKFNKNDNNQDILNEMENLDNQAVEARKKFSKAIDLNKTFNEIIENKTGIGANKVYAQSKASVVGKNKGKFDLLGIPPSAQDFVGLLYYTLGKGKKGDAQFKIYKEHLLDPFARANIDISNARVALANDFKALKKLLGVSPKDLNKIIPGEPYTIGNAIRVYTWTQQGMTVPGLSKADTKILNDFVLADENLQLFANELIAINKDNGYPKPQDGWLAGTITTDLLSGLNTVVRSKYLKQWQENVDEMFSEANLNKLEASFGKGYRDALENILGRMKTGSNRGFKGDSLTGRFTDWINGSVGAIMFFNMKSAVLQTISAVNFVNFTDNNLLKAAAAFGNQPQYWRDVIKLMNSDYLVERRNGLKININEADIAEIAAESKNKAKAFINKILKLGFLPTQIADSFAIASGGATFFRNRFESYKKEGMNDAEAEAQAFQDFRETAEESQQSSRPDRISAQQAGPLGRVILAFANTPAQYARLMQKAASDLKNRRGDDKTNISKILYYGMVQNVIFNALQQALFAMAFDDEEASEEKKNQKYIEIANGMSDSLLRGLGFHGAAIYTLKNVIIKLAQGSKAQDAALELLKISPPISSKIGKLRSAGRTWDWNKKEIYEKGWSLDNPAWLASGQVVSAATNIPLDRGIGKLQNLRDASNENNEEWQRVANALGWSKWQLDWEKEKEKKKRKTKKTNPRKSRSKTSSKSTSKKSTKK